MLADKPGFVPTASVRSSHRATIEAIDAGGKSPQRPRLDRLQVCLKTAQFATAASQGGQLIRPMNTTKFNRLARGLSLCVGLLLSLAVHAAEPTVVIQATPDGGLQPRLVSDAQGGLHLLYFKKRLERRDAREGNLYYRPWLADEERFGTQVRVSSQAFAVQAFAIARAAMAIDGSGRLHVVWYLPRSNAYFYTRSDASRSRFEPQRQIVSENLEGIDAGADVAARGDRVAVVWGAGDLSAEHERAMFGRFSTDNGASFGAEQRISNPDLGACACCAMAVDYLESDSLLLAYRSAIDGIGRHMQLLTVEMAGEDAQSGRYEPVTEFQEWEASYCPLSTNDISLEGERPWLVFETESRIIQMPLPDGERSAVGEAFMETRQKNPSVAVNEAGQRLVAWGEAISHTRGGRLNLRLFSEDGEDMGVRLDEDIQIGDFSFPAAAALPDGRFLLLH